METKKFVTYKEICDIVNTFEDSRDKVLVMLVFDGFYTRLEEIQDLKGSDIKEAPVYKLGGYTISKRTLRAIHMAQKEEVIHTFSYFNNGLDTLIPSDYILREREGYLKRVDIEVGDRFNGYAMNKQSILNRFAKIKKQYKLDFTMSSLYGSGVIHRAIEKIAPSTPKHRVEFLNYLQTEEGVSKGMGYLYYRKFLEMLPRLEKEVD